ncbi:MAG TPA: TonB-dependent receptor [Pseudoxanthomonas sp.]|nr:TonB-dependent receptor [Pseudoxanthomonas sp.]
MQKPFFLSLLLAASVSTALAADAPDELDSLLALSLEQLGEVRVATASRTPSRLTDTPASAFVIGREELRKLGIRSLPEALRLAPNLHVAQINASSHAVSARGLKTSLSNKLLVMIDGRPIYTPLFAGVLWDMQSVLIEDVERIEVVSGPGAAAWGSNAVNGVINIVMRPARETSGGFVKGWTGGHGQGAAVAQTLAAPGDGALRLYAKRERVDQSEDAQGREISDGWTQRQSGFRADWQRGVDEFRLQGDLLRGESSPRPFGAVEVSSHNVTGRWTRTASPERQWSLQGYYDVVDRLDPQVIDDRMTTAALEFSHDSVRGAHRVTWGLGYRHARDESAPGALARLIPDRRTLEWGHAFVQDQIALSGRTSAELGLRVESNSYTGVELLPTARLSLRREDGSLLWGALSRAVRSPARFDREFYFPASEPYFIRGGAGFEAEVSNVAEFGYRTRPTDWLSVSLTGFHHWHDGLRGGEPAPGGGVRVANRVEGRTYGIEGWATLRMPGDWEVAAGFLELRQRLRLMPGFADLDAVRNQGNDPEHQWLLRATRRVGERQQLSALARYVGKLPDPAIPSYVQVDARWSYAPTQRIEVGLGVRNLLDERHAELQPSDGLAPSQFRRTVHLDLRVGW